MSKSLSPCLCFGDGVSDINCRFHVEWLESKTNEHEHKEKKFTQKQLLIIILTDYFMFPTASV